MLRLHDISKTYDAKTVLSHISLEFEPGQTHALIGPSGCGKSTLLRIIMGLVTPDDGEVFFGDRLIFGAGKSRVAPSELREMKRHFGYVIQNGGLFPHLSARQNVLLPMESHSGVLEVAEAESRLDRLAKLTHFQSMDWIDFRHNFQGGSANGSV